MEAFSDADWVGNEDDRRSTTGYCVYFGGNLISWCSDKQKVVSRSSTKSEYRAVASATVELLWVQSLLKELEVNLYCQPPVLWYDNTGVEAMSSVVVFHTRTKRIENICAFC